MLRFALTILLSAFLLFQVQPLIARFILPWFGGSPAVWNTCMLFFQLLLLLGYLYAHVVSTRLKPRGQAFLHLSLLALSLILLPIIPHSSWKPTGSENPVVQILLLLSVTVGAPYFLLSTTGPLVQRWFSLARPGVSPYRLYALSNIGSLAALLTYPVLIEPYFRLGTQAWTWSIGYGLFAVLCGTCAWLVSRGTVPEVTSAGDLPEAAGLVLKPDEMPEETNVSIETPEAAAGLLAESEVAAGPGWADILFWLFLAASPSVLLLATTNQLCQEVAVVPFLWVLPLGLYLISFIIAFDSPRWYIRPMWFALLLLSVGAVVLCQIKGVHIRMGLQIMAYSAALLTGAMCCHGELAGSRPRVQHLTLFYLMISVGGAIGGVFVVIVAPLIFVDYWELHFGLIACVMSSLLAFKRRDPSARHSLGLQIAVYGTLASIILAAAGALLWYMKKEEQSIVTRVRSFYGVMTVKLDTVKDYGDKLELIHGRIRHGMQFLEPDKRMLHTSYYSPDSGVGAAIRFHPRSLAGDQAPRNLRIGVVGLGTGTLASYGQSGDVIRFYELNPEVKRIAYEYFTYCTDSAGQVEVVLGDARLSMEQEFATGGSQQYDVLAIDAFSSDAIPMHLMTRECFALYWQHLRPDGILAVHISNRYLNLRPVVHSLAVEAGYTPLLLEWNNDKRDPAYSASEWVLITRNKEFIENREVKRLDIPWGISLPELIWTDDYGSLRQVLNF